MLGARVASGTQSSNIPVTGCGEQMSWCLCRGWKDKPLSRLLPLGWILGFQLDPASNSSGERDGKRQE